MKQMNYTPNLTGLTIITDPNAQHSLFFCHGHPKFLIPDFNAEPTDIWLSYEDYLEKTYGPIYDQNGGEIVSHSPIGNGGLMKVEYILDDISFESDEDTYKQFHLTIEGYVIQDGNEAYFLATKIYGDL